MSSQHKPYVPQEIDDIEDRMGSIGQLDFSDRQDERQGHAGDVRAQEEILDEFPEQRVRQAGQTGGETLAAGTHEDGVGMDDLSPETLLADDGARSPSERGGTSPLDKELSIVDRQDIGGGSGLDEAELGRRRPLDNQAWDGEAEPLQAETTIDPEDIELSGDEALNSARDRRRGGEEPSDA